MKKILILLLIALLGLLAYYCIIEGLTIAGFEILSFKQISANSERLDSSIKDAKMLATVQYQSKLQELEEKSTALSEEKEKYESLVKLSTSEEIIQATQSEKYEIEYLWTIVGNYATKENVVIKMDIIKNTSDITGTYNLYDLNFTVTGAYIAITDFIYDVENDDTLQFEISGFSLLPLVGSSTTTDKTQTTSGDLQAQFTVKNININMENLTNISDESNQTIKNENNENINQINGENEPEVSINKIEQ